MAKPLREIMTAGAGYATEQTTAAQAAREMASLEVGALPVCGEAGNVIGMITDRDIAIKVVAQGLDPAVTTVGEFCTGQPVTIDIEATVDDVLFSMKEHKIRRLPVVDNGSLVGIVSQGDIAIAIDNDDTGSLVEAISAAP